MTVQGMRGGKELGIQPSARPANAAVPETSFRDLLEGSLQGTTTTPPTEASKPAETEPVNQEETISEPSETETVEEVVESIPQESEQPEEADEQALAAAVAAAMPAQIPAPLIQPQEEVELPIQTLSQQTTVEPVLELEQPKPTIQEAEVISQPTEEITVQTEQPQPTAPIQTEQPQPILEEAPVQPQQSQPQQSQPAEAVVEQISMERTIELEMPVEIQSAQLTVTPSQEKLQIAAPAMEEFQEVETAEMPITTVEAKEEVPQPMVDAGQRRFDELVAKASRELETAKAPVAPIQEEAEEPQTLLEAPAEEMPSGATEPKLKLEETKVRSQQTDEEETQVIAQPEKLPQGTEQPKVAKTDTAPPQAPIPTPAEQVKAQLIENLEEDKMEFRMQLQPKELGKVDVRMLLEGGKLTVQIMAATPKAVQELQKTSEGLMMSLRMANVQLDTVQIVHQPQETSEHMHGAFNMPSQHQGQERDGQHASHGGASSGQMEDEKAEAEDKEFGRLLDQAI